MGERSKYLDRISGIAHRFSDVARRNMRTAPRCGIDYVTATIRGIIPMTDIRRTLESFDRAVK